MENRTTETGYVAELKIHATDERGIIIPHSEYRFYVTDLTPSDVDGLFNCVVWHVADDTDMESVNFKRSALQRYAMKHGVGAIRQT
jgi:hypothetical protein